MSNNTFRSPYSKHNGHKYERSVHPDDPETLIISCECGDTWTVANDPDGSLGSEDAPEG